MLQRQSTGNLSQQLTNLNQPIYSTKAKAKHMHGVSHSAAVLFLSLSSFPPTLPLSFFLSCLPLSFFSSLSLSSLFLSLLPFSFSLLFFLLCEAEIMNVLENSGY